MTASITNRHDNSVCPYFYLFSILFLPAQAPAPSFGPVGSDQVLRQIATGYFGNPRIDLKDFLDDLAHSPYLPGARGLARRVVALS